MTVRTVPTLSAFTELLKPITWFPPMWAFACGVVASGAQLATHWPLALLGVLLAGPMVCATSQAVNDWFDRHVDAINEPHRPIPSGRMPGRWGLYVAIAWTVLSLLVATGLGIWGFAAAALGLVLAWAYSMPPVRLKQNGWWGNLACGLSYEGLAWITGATRPRPGSTGGVLGHGGAADHRGDSARAVGGAGVGGIGCCADRGPGSADAPPDRGPDPAGALLQRLRRAALRLGNDGQRLRASGSGLSRTARIREANAIRRKQ